MVVVVVLVTLFSLAGLLIVLSCKLKPDGAVTSGILIVLGMWISLKIVDYMDFDDGSVETISTIMIVTLLPAVIYNLCLIPRWIVNNRNKKIEKEIEIDKQQLRFLEKEICDEQAVLHLITLIKSCGANMSNIESNEVLQSKERLKRDRSKKEKN